MRGGSRKACLSSSFYCFAATCAVCLFVLTVQPPLRESLLAPKAVGTLLRFDQSGLQSPRPQVHDAFIFNNEFERLYWRFEEYWSAVDFFHVFESSRSHQGHKKPLRFHDNQGMYEKYKDKIVLHKIPPLESTLCQGDPFVCERHERQAMREILETLISPEDIIIMTDADEIVRNDVLHKIKGGEIDLPTRINTPTFKYSLHWRENREWNQGCVFRFNTTQTANWNDVRRDHTKGWPTVADGGWHLSTFGDVETIFNKLQFAADNDRLQTLREIRKRLHSGQAMYDDEVFFTYGDAIENAPVIARTSPAFYASAFWRYGKGEEPPAMEESVDSFDPVSAAFAVV